MITTSRLAPSTEFPAHLPFRSILFPTDISPASEHAAVMACAFAAKYGAKLQVVHTVLLKDSYWVDANFPLASDSEFALRETRLFVTKTGLDNYPYEILVEAGSALTVVAKAVEARNIDLVLLGTAGNLGLKKLIFGSHAEQIFRTVRCPVITVGPHVPPEKCKAEFRHILFSTDFDYETADALPYAAALAREYDADLTLLHIIDAPQHTHAEKVYAREEAHRAQLLEMFGKCEISVPHKPGVFVDIGDAAEEIVKIALGVGADLIVMGVHPAEHGAARSHALRGHAYHVSVNAHCPVLTVRPQLKFRQD
jgi:nucleotide-binding universal stress UspA family protein